MSEFTSTTQTPWEETDEEVQRRRLQSKATQPSWTGTLVGLFFASLTLAFLLAA